jgi:signal transduction histidine kinase
MNSVRHFSLTRRVIATVIACQLLLIICLTAAAVFYGRKQLRSAFDDTLQGRAMSTLALVRYTEDHPHGLMFDSDLLPPSFDPMHKDLFVIRQPNGQILAESGTLPQETETSDHGYANFELGGIPYRSVTLRNVQILDVEDDVKVIDRVTLTYAASLLGVQGDLEELGFWVAGTSLLLLLLASALVTWGVRRHLAPLRELAEKASVISMQNWNFHPPDRAKLAQELVPLTGAIEAVLTRLHDGFRQQRDFTSDAAHELKTSVAILKSTLQSLLHRPRSEQEYQAGLAQMLEDCGRLEDLLDRMLRLARIEQWAESDSPDSLPVSELTSTCESAIARIQALAREHDVEIDLVNPVSESIYMRANPEDLEVIWVNLLENAVRYSPRGSKVLMRIHQNGGGTTRVSVEDSGPGIPPEELPHVFERFRRGDESRSRSTGGFGLGLAICKAFVTAYGGSIEAVLRPAKGTELQVHFPTEPAQSDDRSSVSISS